MFYHCFQYTDNQAFVKRAPGKYKNGPGGRVKLNSPSKFNYLINKKFLQIFDYKKREL